MISETDDVADAGEVLGVVELELPPFELVLVPIVVRELFRVMDSAVIVETDDLNEFKDEVLPDAGDVTKMELATVNDGESVSDPDPTLLLADVTDVDAIDLENPEEEKEEGNE